MIINLSLDEDTDRLLLFGMADRNLKLLRETLQVYVAARGDMLKISGEPDAVDRAAHALRDMQRHIKQHSNLDREQAAEIVRRTLAAPAAADGSDILDVAVHGHPLKPKTVGQARYIQAIRENDLVFCTGPAGTGKTYLAVALAVSMLRRNAMRRLVLVRPAVEAGEKLGFLPGDMQAKVNPYLRPLLDALNDMMPFEQIRRFMAHDIIEVAPLAYMRGRTLNESVVILDEAQNTTPSQMLMFLTRLGEGSKMIVTGDPSQVDLEPGQTSGLVDAHRTLRRVKGIAFVELDKSDIVRHKLLQKIVQAYARDTPRPGPADEPPD